MPAQPDQRPLEANVNLVKFPKDAPQSYVLDQATPWIAALLAELNEDAGDQGPERLAETALTVRLELTRKWTNDTGEYMLAKGMIDGHYAAEDVKTLAPLMVPLVFPFKAVFLGEMALKLEEYLDADEAWLDSNTWQIYPYRKNVVDLGEMLHEQLFLHRLPYPSVDNLHQAVQVEDTSPDFSSEDDGDLDDDGDDWDEDGSEFDTDDKSRQ
jgi:hypothetical protein